MKNKSEIFILSTYIFSFIGFLGLGFLNINFAEVFINSLGIILFLAASLFPAIIGIVLLGKDYKDNLKLPSILDLFFIVVFLFIHMILYYLLVGEEKIFDGRSLIAAWGICIFSFALQEAGWIDLVHKRYLSNKGLFKSIVIVGLFKSLSIFPLLLLNGFPVNPEVFAYFSVGIIGLSALSIFLRRFSGSILTSIIFTGFVYGFSYFLNMNNGITLVVIGFLEVIIAYGLQDLIKNK